MINQRYPIDSPKESVPEKERLLICRLRSGSGKAFDNLYKMYSPSLMGVLMQIVKQQETAEDLLQECFIKINRNIYRYEEKSPDFSPGCST